ncbi:dihydrolipoamide acetyltransferase family protein [Marinobacter persicus]|uniref:Dihydrolipoamide acetyltransferase component of pyruvate dehydrogenase complex n=1 Tax=Marinobacter persicus TaxID=930118 RepID=A0A2S6G3B1_9GAMM|nr:dihydrolipoamide acetyltransferase family protein [Marinobacter persicus]PPK50211.1 pyruvate dehydrogenase E2 component (dihydrolipoamide acetyltransferase) [Marinobacter persicus]PPK52668.1 pyruvate dehydrogenase E2 component (dihydrolipoamide acetyltransferase) [Marinobacter persicus]PPK56684.1 pyruvate dehydrogenase E2 component (dihydrolipoamide acetyltransferase) [Marinobacter persicus]
MSKDYKLEDPGEGITEAEVVEVMVSEGDEVKDGDPLLTVETDKAANEIPANFNGTVESVKVKEGETIKVGQVLVTYNDGSGDDSEEEPDKESKESEASDQETEKEDKDDEKNEKKSGKADKKKEKKEKPEEQSTSEEDEADADQGKEESAEKANESESTDSDRPVPAAPATRQLARELHVDLHQVEGSGPGGRVTKEDVEQFSEEAASRESSRARSKAPKLPDFSQWGTVRREPLSAIRQAIARNMSQSWQEIPHVMHQSVADITELERFRRRHQDEVERRGGKLTMTVLVIKALVAALKQFPRFNTSLDTESDELIYKEYYDIGVAVATDAGLLVPVLREVDRKDVFELASELSGLADKAREGELKKQDMEGATFSLTNPGPIGATSFTPIINHPEVAILGMGSAELSPVATGHLDNYKIEARLRMPLCLAYDHRVNDGAEAAQFLKTIVDTLEDPETFMLSS